MLVARNSAPLDGNTRVLPSRHRYPMPQVWRREANYFETYILPLSLLFSFVDVACSLRLHISYSTKQDVYPEKRKKQKAPATIYVKRHYVLASEVRRSTSRHDLDTLVSPLPCFKNVHPRRSDTKPLRPSSSRLKRERTTMSHSMWPLQHYWILVLPKSYFVTMQGHEKRRLRRKLKFLTRALETVNQEGATRAPTRNAASTTRNPFSGLGA